MTPIFFDELDGQVRDCESDFDSDLAPILHGNVQVRGGA
jgi:hypothetical protein